MQSEDHNTTINITAELMERIKAIHQAHQRLWIEKEQLRIPRRKTWLHVLQLGCDVAERQLGLKHK